MPPPPKKIHPGLCNRRAGVPPSRSAPPNPPRVQCKAGGGPQDPASRTPPFHCTGRTSLTRVSPGLGELWQGGWWGVQLPPRFWGPLQAAGKGRCVQLRTRSCIPASGEAGGVSRWRRNLLFAPVLQEAGGRKGGGGGVGADSCYYLILFSCLHPGISAMCRLLPGRLGRP